MKFKPYSFSKIHTYYSCPKQFKYCYIDKISVDRDFTDPKFFVRGRFIHAYIADRLKGGSGLLNGYPEVDVDDKLELISKADGIFENEYINMTFDFDITGVEKNIKLCDDLMPTSDKDFLIKGYIDYYAVQNDLAVIVDWKSGKSKDNPSYEQLELYAIWLLEKYDNITEVDLIFYYLEHDIFQIKTISQKEIKEFKRTLLSKINQIELEEEFLPISDKHCMFCPYFSQCVTDHGEIHNFPC